tara:strand:+ start:217 stop:450 length:234 start_codon:yes stop_codon:yes gene_type:complete
MDNQHLINVLLGLSLTIVGWFARELWSAVKDLKTDLSKLRESLPRAYVAREDHRDGMQTIMEMLNKIFDKLDGKVDK